MTNDISRLPADDAVRSQSAAPSSHPVRSAPSNGVPRDPQTKTGTEDLASFLNRDRVEPEQRPVSEHRSANHKPIMIGAAEADNDAGSRTGSSAQNVAPSDGKDIACGPLLNYRKMLGSQWWGSTLIVTKGGGKTQNYVPTMCVRRVTQADGRDYFAGANTSEAANGASRIDHAEGSSSTAAAADDSENNQPDQEVKGVCIYSDPRNTFWAFDLCVEMEDDETQWEYWYPEMRFLSATKPTRNAFYVPAVNESMRMMFHSCNGFSVGTDTDAWSGCALWNEVARRHADRPFHVMLGGGDQIYNDGIRVDGPLRPWTNIGNPKKRRDYPFPEKLRSECDDYYLQNYIQWYSEEPFAAMNGRIPAVNIWDDHDIIDGFGSYIDEFMKCDVFRGIGGVAHKYYMLFQHHLPPPKSTYTTDHAESLQGPGQGEDPNQLQDTYVPPMKTDDCYIVGEKHGPYVAEHSYNIYCKLGARVAMLGIDARTERTRHQVNYPETYDLLFNRLVSELQAAQDAGQPMQHLILLLGIPIAYPRLTWLENVFRSPLMGPVKLLNRRFGFAGGLFNQFDGSIDLLDDLDDHYTARTHKKERAALIERLQDVAAKFSVRVTILGGDVHLAALGRFYSNPKLSIPAEQDHRYMANVVSSAITNKPPPQAVANLLARRNKIHHLNHDTDETLLNFFDKDPGDSNKTASSNHVTMPSRNFAIITENSPNNAAINGEVNGGGDQGAGQDAQSFVGHDGHKYLHKGEVDSGTQHKAATPATHGRANDGSLDVCIRVEVDPSNREGKTDSYGLTVPLLKHNKPAAAPQPFPPAEEVQQSP